MNLWTSSEANTQESPSKFLLCVRLCMFSPVSEFWAQGEVVRKEVLLWWDGPLQPEERVVLHTGLPQVFTGPIVHHVETQQRFPALILFKRRRQHSLSHSLTPTFCMWQGQFIATVTQVKMHSERCFLKDFKKVSKMNLNWMLSKIII